MARFRSTIWLVVAVAVSAAVSGCVPARFTEAARVLADIDAGTGPSALKEGTPDPRRRTVGYSVAGWARVADLYLPGDGAKASMVLVPGATPHGKDDPRLVAFAETLARARFEVLVPELPGHRRLEVGPADIRALADAYLYLDRRGGGRRLGVTAISYATGPAVAALFEPGVGERVDFVLAIGGYHDIEAAITFFTTGKYRRGATEPWRWRRANAYGKWVFVLSNAGRLADPGDRRLLRQMAERKLADPGADVSDLAARLGAEGGAVHALLVNRDPERVAELIAALPPAVRDDIAALDLKRRDLGSLGIRFVLIHGRDDPIIPETESQALAAALPGELVDLYLVDSLDHVDPQPAGPIDTLILLQAIYKVLTLRDGAE